MSREDVIRIPKWSIWVFILAAIIVLLTISQPSNNSPQNGESFHNTIPNYVEIKPLVNVDSFSNVTYPHWDHMPLTYWIDPTCDPRLINLMKLAFEKIKNETGGLVHYVPANETPDIQIYCAPANYSSSSFSQVVEDTGCLMESNHSDIISHAEITIYGQGFVCDTGYPSVEVHELLHTLGFVHSPHENSIMYPFTADSSAQCKITHIDSQYISCLRNTYSNGKIPGNCYNIDTVVDAGYSNISCVYCPNNWYAAKGSLDCCPEPNMVIDSGGYCE